MSMKTAKSYLKKLSATISDDAVDEGSGYMITAIKGGVGYEYPLDAWFNVKKGHRWNVAYYYTTNLVGGADIKSSSWVAQDNSINNYTEIRMVVKNEGSTNVEYIIEQSPDNSNWIALPGQSVTLTSDGVATLKADIYMPYVRVHMINHDSNAQTSNMVYVVML